MICVILVVCILLLSVTFVMYFNGRIKEIYYYYYNIQKQKKIQFKLRIKYNHIMYNQQNKLKVRLVERILPNGSPVAWDTQQNALKGIQKSPVFECQCNSTEVISEPHEAGRSIHLQGKGSSFIFQFPSYFTNARPWVLVPSQESNPQPPTLPTELLLPG